MGKNQNGLNYIIINVKGHKSLGLPLTSKSKVWADMLF